MASASLAIYLTHFGVLPLGALGFPPGIVVAVALVVGIGVNWAFGALARRFGRRRRDRGTAAALLSSAGAAGRPTPLPVMARGSA
jgi:hypothetical protein